MLVVLVAAVLATGIARLRIGFAVDGFFVSDDPALARALDHYRTDGFEPPDRLLSFGFAVDDPFGADTLALLRRCERTARAHAIVRRVLTLASAAVPGRPGAPPREVARSSTFRRLLVGSDGRSVGGILALDRWSSSQLAALCAALRTEVAEAGSELQLCGLPYHTLVSRQLVRDDMARFLPIGTAVSAALLLWLVPHWRLALLALLVVPLTLLSTLGLMGFCGVEITMLTSTLPTLLLCMSVADGLHMVERFREERSRDGDPRRAAARTFAALFVPCLLTSLTTIVGFASLLRAELRDLGCLGLFAAVGMGFAFVYTMVLLPPLMSWVRSAAGRRRFDPTRGLLRAAAALQRLPAWSWIACAVLAAVLSVLAARGLTSEHRITGDLWPRSAVMRQLSWYERRFVGVVPAEVVVDTPAGFDTATRAQLATFVARLEGEPGVTRTLSVHDLFRDGVSPLLLAGLQAAKLLPAGLLGDGGARARILVFRGDLGTRAFEAFERAVGRHCRDLDRIDARLVGAQKVGTALVQSMTADLRDSFLGSVVVIFVLVWLSCRRLPLALAAMLACLMPMLWVLGLMVALGHSLRPLTVISFCVALGLMVDDAVHLALRWREQRARGDAADAAVRHTLRTAGRPVVITTMVLLVGFVTILGSGFRGTFVFGLLVDLSLAFALLSALVLLPALLRVLGAHADGRRRNC